MSFDWDLANIAHLARHRITPDDVEELFRREPRQENYDVVDGEDRWTVVGRTKSLRILAIVFTIRGESIRPITGWDADKTKSPSRGLSKGTSIMSAKKLTIPPFTSEKEEADWWYRNRRSVEASWRQADREGKTVSLAEVLERAKRKATLKPVTLRLPGGDIDTARRLAEEKGIGYQTYIKILLHDALRTEVARQTQASRK